MSYHLETSSKRNEESVFGLAKNTPISNVDETSRDSGIGQDDILDVTCLSPLTDSNSQTPQNKSSVKPMLELNFRSFRCLSFDSPVGESLSIIPDFESSIRDLSVSPSDLTTRTCLRQKRPIRDEDEVTADKKRRRGPNRLTRFNSSGESELTGKDDTQENIKATLDEVSSDDNLISDGSKSYCLPTVAGKHQDLKSISSETLAKVVNGEYDDIIGNYVIVDCRYPYEFEAGHIKNAKNYHSKELVKKELVDTQIGSDDLRKRTVLFFHCEFSSERGPKLCRFLRSMDRAHNTDCYPSLFYPEVYILHGGYKEFFNSQKELCFPQNYVPMLQDGFKEDLKKFKVKSKSWGGEKHQRSMKRGLKF